MRSAALLACLLLAAVVLGQRRRTLSDETFEHITQAATGQTTGVWFVNFCSSTAKTCKELAQPWEELGKDLLQQQLFLTTVDVRSSPRLTQRFGVTTLPTLLLFRDGKMYRFDGKLAPGTDIKQTLSAFVQGGYAATEALDVPPVPSAFDWVARNAQLKLETIKAALQAQDLAALALALLPVLGVCLLAMALMAANLTKKSKRE